MGEQTTPKGSLSRRSFLKATGAVGALSAAGSMASAASWLTPALEAPATEEREMFLCHQFHCLSGCILKATVRD